MEWLLALMLTGSPTNQPAPEPARAIDGIIEANGGEVAVAFIDLGTGDTLLRNEHVVMHAASTMKVPVMLALFERIDQGSLRLDQPIAVRNEFTSIVDGSKYSLDPGEDSDPELYESAGTAVPLEELMRRMITRSSNLATNLLIELAGTDRIARLLDSLGAKDMRVLRGVEDDKAYRLGLNNVATAWDLALVMRAIAEGKAVSPEASAKMLEILAAQEHNTGIPAGLPEGTRVAHKTGWITKIRHDAAIVIPDQGGGYVLVVMTRGFERKEEADRVIAAISKAVWERRVKSEE